MRSRNRRSLHIGRKVFFLLFPVVLLLFFTVAYGAWENYVSVNVGLTVPREPRISVDSFLLNAQDDILTVIVNETTNTVETTDPNPLQILINITNRGETPLTKLVINDTLPQDWEPSGLSIQTYRTTEEGNIQTEGENLLISPDHYTILYDSTDRTLSITLPDIKTATGKLLTQNSSILSVLELTYSHIGTLLPPEYEDAFPTYTNTVTTTAFFTVWRSQPATTATSFTAEPSSS